MDMDSSSFIRKRTSPSNKVNVRKSDRRIILPQNLPIDKVPGYLVINDNDDKDNIYEEEMDEEEMELFYGPLEEIASSRLTIMDEMVILGINESSGNLPLLNDRLSFALRGALLVEMSLRNMISVIKPPRGGGIFSDDTSFMDYLIVPRKEFSQRSFKETLLEEVFKTMTSIQRETNPPQLLSIHTWISLLSGDSWIPTICPTTNDFLKIPSNIKKIQLTEMRERLSKGLVDKGILSTSKRTIFPFIDISTHPLRSLKSKEFIIQRFLAIVRHGGFYTNDQSAIASTSIGSSASFKLQKVNVNLRTIVMVLCCSAGDILGDALKRIFGAKAREDALKRIELISFLYRSPPPISSSSSSVMIAGVLEYFDKILTFI